MDANEQTPPVAPQPLCAVFEPLLPLLQLHELDATEEMAVRKHVAGCAWCRAQLAEYGDLCSGLRRHYGAEQGAVAQLVLEDILTSAVDDEPATSTIESIRPIPVAPRRQLPRFQLAAAAALAEALLFTLLAGALFRWQGSPAGGTEVPGLGTLEKFPLPTAHSQPRIIVAGHDGNLWFTENDRIGRITPRGVITEFRLPAGVVLDWLAAGPDGNI